MARKRECPKCGSPMEHQQEDPDVGVMGAWVCTLEDCDHVEPDYDDYADDGFLD